MVVRHLTLALAVASWALLPSAASLDADATSSLLLPILPETVTEKAGEILDQASQGGELQFELRHLFHHGTHKYPGLHRRLDIHPERHIVRRSLDGDLSSTFTILKARSNPIQIERLVDRSRDTIMQMLDFGRMTGRPAVLSPSAWSVDEIPGPNVTDKETVITFAKMTADAYVEKPAEDRWMEVGGGFNYTEDFGWEGDGLRGHIFADTTNKTVVIGLKGTSPAVFDGSETTTNDKENDNLFFSCCCGQGGRYLWRQVCDCQTDTFTCNSTCLVKAMREKNRYYYAAQDLYHNVTELYPDADVWLAGHSLGGAMSSLLGMTYGLPTITFEAIPEAMPAARLNLPVPPGYRIGSHQDHVQTGIHHFGHTADPVYMGKCNGVSSFCTLGGYALQSQCHSGKRCAFDTVGDLGWAVSLSTHKIESVIRDVLEKYDDPARCEADEDCTDCYNWSYFESNDTQTTTTARPSTSSYTRTRTETCKTPGWWGCLDESSSTTTTTSSSTSSTSTSTCETPGWFGCKDSTSTTTTSTTTTSSSSSPASPSATTTPYSLPPATSSPLSTGCQSPGWFGGCKDASTTTQSSPATKARITASGASVTATLLPQREDL